MLQHQQIYSKISQVCSCGMFLKIQCFHCFIEVLTSCGGMKPTQKTVRYSLLHLKEEEKHPLYYVRRYIIWLHNLAPIPCLYPFSNAVLKLAEKGTHSWVDIDMGGTTKSSLLNIT